MSPNPDNVLLQHRSRSNHQPDKSRAVDTLTRKSTAEMSRYTTVRVDEQLPTPPLHPQQVQQLQRVDSPLSSHQNPSKPSSSRHIRDASTSSVPTLASTSRDSTGVSPVRRDRRLGADSPIMEDTTASISAASALRREKEKREQREREIELEWEREQERAVELEKERERSHELERRQKRASIGSKQTRASHEQSQVAASQQSFSHGQESFSGAAMSGRDISMHPTGAAPATGGFNPFANCADNEIVIVKGGSAVSDLTCSTMDSGSDGEAAEDRTQHPPGKQEAAAREKERDKDRKRSHFEPIEPLPPLGMPSPVVAVGTPVAFTPAASAAATPQAAAVAQDPLLQSVALLLREALDPNAAPQTALPTAATPASAGPAITGTVDRAKALAAARLLISTLLGQPAAEGGAELAAAEVVRAPPAQVSPASQQTQQQGHAAGRSADPYGPTAGSYQAAGQSNGSPQRDRDQRPRSGVPPLPRSNSRGAADLAPSPEVFTHNAPSLLHDDFDGDGLYSNYHTTTNSSASNSPLRGRPPVLLEADTSELAEMSSTNKEHSPAPSSKGGPRMEPYPQKRHQMSDTLSPKTSQALNPGPPPVSPKSPKVRRENEERPPQARKAVSESSQARMRQSERVLQALEEVSSVNERYVVPEALHSDDSVRPKKYGLDMPLAPLTRNTVALQSGISVITEDTFETKERRREKKDERGRALSRSQSQRVPRSSSVEAAEARKDRADTRPGIARSASVDAGPRQRGSPKGLTIDPTAPYVGSAATSRQSTPGSRATTGEGFPRTPKSQESRLPKPQPSQQQQQHAPVAPRPESRNQPSGSGGNRQRTDSRDSRDSFGTSHRSRSLDEVEVKSQRTGASSRSDARTASERIAPAAVSTSRRSSSDRAEGAGGREERAYESRRAAEHIEYAVQESGRSSRRSDSTGRSPKEDLSYPAAQQHSASYRDVPSPEPVAVEKAPSRRSSRQGSVESVSRDRDREKEREAAEREQERLWQKERERERVRDGERCGGRENSERSSQPRSGREAVEVEERRSSGSRRIDNVPTPPPAVSQPPSPKDPHRRKEGAQAQQVQQQPRAGEEDRRRSSSRQQPDSEDYRYTRSSSGLASLDSRTSSQHRSPHPDHYSPVPQPASRRPSSEPRALHGPEAAVVYKGEAYREPYDTHSPPPPQQPRGQSADHRGREDDESRYSASRAADDRSARYGYGAPPEGARRPQAPHPDRSSGSQQYSYGSPEHPAPPLHRSSSHRSSEYDSQRHPSHAPPAQLPQQPPYSGRPPSVKSAVYQLDGLELTEEEMTFISRDMNHVSPSKLPHRDYYPRDPETRRGAPPVPPPPQSGRKGWAGSGAAPDDHTVHTASSRHYYRPPPAPAQSPYAPQDTRERAAPPLEHRSRSSGNMYAPPPPPQPSQPHSMHRSSSQGQVPRPSSAVAQAPPSTGSGRAPTGSGGGAVASRVGWWSCSICTLENPPSYLACDACGMVRGPSKS
jgi:hypothetical protein